MGYLDQIPGQDAIDSFLQLQNVFHIHWKTIQTRLIHLYIRYFLLLYKYW
jgi:hypothetical protein